MEYRKDALPKETIGKVIGILKKMNINFTITDEISYKNLWWSLKINLLDYPNVSTNGKGNTRELALASGLAELIERLQGGFLIENIQPSEYGEYHGLLNDDICAFSNKLIKVMCGTNGLASGNTVTEAICQGFFEVLERYVLREFYLGKHRCITGCFSKELFKNTRAYTLISEIEKNGLLPFILDGTCCGRFPVLGVLVINPQSHTYLFNVASDFDVDICLSRCITELYQGRTIQSLLESKPARWMNRIFNETNEVLKYEFFNQVIFSQGGMPIEKLYEILSKDSKNENLSIFKNIRSNDECHELIKQLCRKNGLNPYICDLSLSEFCTCRVYVPGYSEIYEQNANIAKQMLNSIDKVKTSLMKYANKLTSITELKNDIKTLLSYDVYRHHCPIYRFVPDGLRLHNELITDDIMHILSIISLYQKDIDDAIFYAKKSQDINNLKHIRFLLWYLNVKKEYGDQAIHYYYDEHDGICNSIMIMDDIYNNKVELLERK